MWFKSCLAMYEYIKIYSKYTMNKSKSFIYVMYNNLWIQEIYNEKEYILDSCFIMTMYEYSMYKNNTINKRRSFSYVFINIMS